MNRLLSPSVSDELLAGLDEAQRQAAEALHGPVCILAGAGTGKTRALTHRIAYGVASGVYPPKRVMALTFTNRAAAELGGRLRSLGAGEVAARTFHASALAQLSFFWPQLVGGRAPEVLPAKARLLAQAADSLKLAVSTALLRDVAGEIEWRKARRLSIADYANFAHREVPGLSADAALALQQRYEDLKDERRMLDFEDVLLVTAGMLASEKWVAQAVHKQYRFFVVDEYQDVSPLQQELLQLWLGSRGDLCVVGDASQTIYSFAGASNEFLLKFAHRYPDATVVRLVNNYRSVSGVVHLANRLIHAMPGAVELVAASEATESGVPVLSEWSSDEAEAEGVAQAVQAQIASGIPAQKIAVLYRMNTQATSLESAFSAKGVFFRQAGGTPFFQIDALQKILLELRSFAKSDPKRDLYQTVYDLAVSYGYSSEPPAPRGSIWDKWQALNALISLADQASPEMNIPEFVADLLSREKNNNEPEISSVVFSTLHAAKGLEWDHVHLVGVSDGLIPISYARSEEQISEERRLLYVGVTRARKSLRVHFSTRATSRGRARKVSRFLVGLCSDSGDAGLSPGQ